MGRGEGRGGAGDKLFRGRIGNNLSEGKTIPELIDYLRDVAQLLGILILS